MQIDTAMKILLEIVPDENLTESDVREMHVRAREEGEPDTATWAAKKLREALGRPLAPKPSQPTPVAA